MGLSVAAANLYLDRKHGTAYGTLVEVGMLDGDPETGGAELTAADCPGYARYVVSDFSTLWLPAEDATKTSNLLQFADPTAEWLVAGQWDCIFVNGVEFDWAPLVDPVVVTAAGTGPDIQLVRGYGNASDFA